MGWNGRASLRVIIEVREDWRPGSATRRTGETDGSNGGGND